MMSDFPKKITSIDKYRPAMEITDQADADAYFEKCVWHDMVQHGMTRDEAEQLERRNLGCFAGYYDTETRERVERLFCCAHPIFGSIAKNGAPTSEQAFNAGRELAAASSPQATSTKGQTQ